MGCREGIPDVSSSHRFRLEFPFLNYLPVTSTSILVGVLRPQILSTFVQTRHLHPRRMTSRGWTNSPLPAPRTRNNGCPLHPPILALSSPTSARSTSLKLSSWGITHLAPQYNAYTYPLHWTNIVFVSLRDSTFFLFARVPLAGFLIVIKSQTTVCVYLCRSICRFSRHLFPQGLYSSNHLHHYNKYEYMINQQGSGIVPQV